MKTKKVIHVTFVVLMFITEITVFQSCSNYDSDMYSQNVSKSEIDKLKSDFQLKDLDCNIDPQNIKSFKTINEARDYIESLKKIKISNLTIKYNQTSKKDGLFLLTVKDYIGKNLRFKVLREGEYTATTGAGFFSNFVFSFKVKDDGSIDKENVYLATVGVPIGWSYGSNQVRNNGYNSFYIVGQITWGISVEGQGIGYIQETDIIVTVDIINETVTFIAVQ